MVSFSLLFFLILFPSLKKILIVTQVLLMYFNPQCDNLIEFTPHGDRAGPFLNLVYVPGNEISLEGNVPAVPFQITSPPCQHMRHILN